MREEMSLVHVALYTAAGEVADTERTLEVRRRSMLQADVETSVHLCLLHLSTASCPPPPACADPVIRLSTQPLLAWMCFDIALKVLTYGF